MKQLHVFLSDRSDRQLRGVCRKLGTTKSGAVRHAISLLEMLVKERGAGNSVVVRRNGSDAEIEVPL